MQFIEDVLEKAFWEFDEERKRNGDERYAFKRQMRIAIALHTEDLVGGAGRLVAQVNEVHVRNASLAASNDKLKRDAVELGNQLREANALIADGEKK